MDLVYTNADHTTIQATLAEGDVLGNHTGPETLFVPTDPANREFGDILERGLQVAAYVAPAPPA